MGAVHLRTAALAAPSVLVIISALSVMPAGAQQLSLPAVDVVTSRIGQGVVGASTSIITAEDIERSPAQTLPDILSREPGVQVTNSFGAVNGARSVVDMRGFGATASSNTLILVNGRRINDLDIAGVDLAAIPKQSIERIEITRGNSGAVLYGDGAVGGVINIVTKSGVAQPPKARIDTTFGSYNYREGNLSVSGASGPWSGSAFSTAINSDGYRENNFYRQLSGVGEIRYTVEQGSAYLNVTGDNQWVGLPGGRRVEPAIGLDLLTTDRRGAATPYDWADKSAGSITAGFTRMFFPGAELIVDGGYRRKNERGAFFGDFVNPASSVPRASVDTQLTTASLTPRIKLDQVFNGIPWRAIGGIDYYHTDYESDRPIALGALPIHRYDLTQSSLAAYWQQTVTILPSTDISGGVRLQNTRVNARDAFDPNAPGAVPVSCFPPFGCFGDLAGIPLDRNENNYAYHVGIEHRFNPNLAVFGRIGRSFRVPNVDERVGMVTSLNAEPTTFDLRTQTSQDIEGGVRLHVGALDVQTSVFGMRLKDEILFRFGPNFAANNINLDPTQRYGWETQASLRVNDRLRLKGGFAYTRAVFREGLFEGNDVPLVSPWTGNLGVSWDILDKQLVLDAVVRYVGERRMDNDQMNLQPLVPAYTTMDLRIGGEIERFFWSVSVINLFDKSYYDYSIASPFPFGAGSQLGTYNAYPLPGRTFMARAGVKLP